MHRQQYPTNDLQTWILTKIPHARHPIHRYHGGAPSQYTNSWVWHAGYYRINVPIQAMAHPCRPWPISQGACVDHLVHHICLLAIFVVSQIIGASFFCNRTSPQNFLDAYSTIVRVFYATPILEHRIVVVLVLRFQIFSGIYPPLTIYLMSATPLPLLSHNVVI